MIKIRILPAVLIAVLTAVLCLTACHKIDSSEPPYDETTTVPAPIVSETEEVMPETDVKEAESAEPDSEFTTSIEEPHDPYVIYWGDGGENSENKNGFVTPDVIINEVLAKYGYEEDHVAYAADWIVLEYLEEESSDDGELRGSLHHVGILDMVEGYTALMGGEVTEITENIAKSLLDTYELESVRVSEMHEDILTVEKEDRI